jgi:hypothetical protein
MTEKTTLHVLLIVHLTNRRVIVRRFSSLSTASGRMPLVGKKSGRFAQGRMNREQDKGDENMERSTVDHHHE